MKLALSISALVLCATAATAGAQKIPPTPPVPPARPAPAPRPLATPWPAPDFNYDFDYNFDYDLQSRMGDLQSRSLEMANRARAEADRALQNIDVQRIQDMATAQINLSVAGWNLDGIEGRYARAPRAPWAQGDPADSLYRLARQAFNNGDWRRAANAFHDVGQKFPRSAYVADCAYYEAFSRYRIGTTEELHNALALLSDQSTPALRSSMKGDVAALAARIRGALAARGDQQAAAQIAQAAQKNGGCDREDMSVKAEALNALGQMDPASATPLLERVLARKDTCSAELKRSALFMLATRGDSTATNALIGVATNADEDPNLRSEAISFLARMPGDAALAALENLVKSSPDESIQRAAVRALAQTDSPRAHQGVRALIERADVSEGVRSEAIMSLAGDHATADDAAYLRGVYPKMPSERLKESILRTLARMGGADNQQFLLAVARNTSESSEVRGTAIGYAGRDASVSVTDLVKLYDASESRNLREQVIGVLGRRTEPEATDKLMDIARTSTDPYARRDAISVLSRNKNDPRVTKFLLDLVGK